MSADRLNLRGSFMELVNDLPCGLSHLEKVVRRHDDLDCRVFSDVEADAEHAVLEANAGRLLHEEDTIKIVGHFHAPTGLIRHSETPVQKVNESLHAPLFRDPVSEPFAHKWNELITRADPLRANGRRRLAPRGHSSLLRLPTLTPVES